jgi:deoxyadenosine/deoxycytidine kinase
MWYNYVKDQTPPLSGIIYLTTPPEICAERITLRGRKGEEAIPLDYLKELDSYQRTWIYSPKTESLNKLEYRNFDANQTTIEEVQRFIGTLKST